MDSSPRCDRCRAPLARGPLGGVCPACVFRDALSVPPESAAATPLFPEASGDFDGMVRAEPGAFPRDFGAYTLLQQIGQGGMGVVHRARHRLLGRQVALKLLIAGEFSSPDFVDRFRREAATAASLRHPGIVAVHEFGDVAGQPFLAMELVEGITLAERIRERPLPPRDAARYLRAVAEAVQHAHDSGLLHRDLKPANILLDAGDHPRVTDFGLAKRLDGSTDLTLTGQLLGSPHYLAPEAAMGGRSAVLSPASDVYSLGATLYHALTGRPPLLADSLAETLAQVRDQAPVSPRLLNPAIPADLETICLKCLEKSPTRRYATAREFAEDLGRWERGESIRARPATPLERAAKWTRRHPARAALATRAGAPPATGTDQVSRIEAPSRLRWYSACAPSHDHHARSTPFPIQSGSDMIVSSTPGPADWAEALPAAAASRATRSVERSGRRAVMAGTGGRIPGA
ncbi:MAG: serine/threonine protein kinase [Verrucomicrobia bacterium]|nr:serine/threonine protein kinase [Verrucomicrobiota bacterium]